MLVVIIIYWYDPLRWDLALLNSLWEDTRILTYTYKLTSMNWRNATKYSGNSMTEQTIISTDISTRVRMI